MFNSIKKWFSGTAEPVEKKNYHVVGDASPGTLGELIAGGCNYVTPYEAASIYRTSSAVAIAVDMIAEEVERIKPVLKIGDEYIDDHPVLELLSAPNPFESGSEFLNQLSHDWLLNHDAFVTMIGSIRSNPGSIYSVSPQLVSVSENVQDRHPQVYNVTNALVTGNFHRKTAGRQPVRYVDGMLKELYHMRGYSSRSNFTCGDSPLSAIMLEARQHILGRYHNLKLLQNGGRLTLVAVFRDRLEPDELKERREAIHEQIAGAENAGKIAAISSDDMELQEFGTNNKDMDYTTMDRVVFHTTMTRYKIPLPLVTNEATTFNNMENAVFHLYDRAIIPCYESLMSNLSKALLPRYGLDPAQAQLTYNPESIPALQQRRLEELKTRKEIGVETDNELRSMLPNREPLEGGNFLYKRSTEVPVGRDLFTDDNATSAEEQARLRMQQQQEEPPQ